MRTLIAATLILLTTAGQSACGRVLWSGDFSTGDLSQWTGRPQYQNAPEPSDRLKVVPGDGGPHLEATVRPGDLHSNGARAEVLLDKPMFRDGDETWFRWQTCFPADFKAEETWHVWTQWHQTLPLGNGGPPVAFELHGDQLRLRLQAGLYDARQDWAGGVVWRAPLDRGRWHTYVLHVKWSQDPKIGFVELWVDGKPAVPLTRHSTLDTDGVVYLKQGLYRDRKIGFPQTVWHRGMIVADDRKDVLP